MAARVTVTKTTSTTKRRSNLGGAKKPATRKRK